MDAWPRISNSNLKFKNCLFGATNLLKNNDKEKWVYSGYGITFDAAGSWNFCYFLVRNVVILVVGNSSSSHAGNDKNNFLALGESPTYSINGSFVLPEKIYGINFNKSNIKFG